MKSPSNLRESEAHGLPEGALSPPALFLLGQFPQHFAQMLAQIPVKHLAPTLRDKNYVALALSFRVA